MLKCISVQSTFNAEYYLHTQQERKLSVERWTLHTLNERHIGDLAVLTNVAVP